MIEFNVSPEEWKIAHQYLDCAPDGTKLPSTIAFYNSKNEIVPKEKFISNPKPYQLYYAFIKKDGKILAYQRGNLGGSVNKAKYAVDESGVIYVIKVGTNNIEFIREAGILNDLNICDGVVKRIDKDKNYIVMNSLGVNLKRFFKESKSLDLADRLDIAIKLCWQLYRLHEGHASKTKTPYVHMDLKPDNVTIDQDKMVHLIDFGMAEKFPLSQGSAKTQAYIYVAYRSRNDTPLKKERYDIVALKRILYLPDSLYCSTFRYIDNIHRNKYRFSILTENELQQFGLTEFISTHANENELPDYSHDKTTALMLCAMLINAKLNLGLDPKVISTDLLLMHAITGTYFSVNKDKVQHVLCNAGKLTLMAALNATDMLNKYDLYSQDNELMKAISHASTIEEACAMVHLKDDNLSQYYSHIAQSSLLSAAITMIKKVNTPYDLTHIINDSNQKISKAILFLAENNMLFDHHYAINDTILVTAITCVNTTLDKSNLINLLKEKVFAADEIVKVLQDKKLAKAMSDFFHEKWIYSNYAIEIGRKLISSSDCLDAFLNLESSELNGVHKTEILRDENNSKALNIILRSGINDLESIKSITYSGAVDTIIKLHSLNIDNLYPRLIDDFQFGYQVANILKCDYAKEVTEEMLANDQIRNVLSNIYGSVEAFNGFKILHDAKLIHQPERLHELSDHLKTVCLLKNNGYESLIKWLINYPVIGYPLSALIKNVNASDNAYYIAKLLHTLPDDKRFEFIKEISTFIDIKSLRSQHEDWRQIKSALYDDKLAFNQWIYSEDELKSKQTLKNIKSKILSTNWSVGLFDTTHYRMLGKTHTHLPTYLVDQADVLRDVSLSTKSHTQAVNEIKQIGQKQLQENTNMFSTYKHSLFGKSEKEQYLAQFETDEIFERAFVNK